MNRKITMAFDEIKASDELKDHTESFLLKNRVKKVVPFRRYALAAAAFVLLFVAASGVMLSRVPAYHISVEGENESVELLVNVFDRVVTVKNFGETTSLSENELKNLHYNDAVALILENDKAEEEESAEVSVGGKNKKKRNAVIDSLKNDQEVQVYEESLIDTETSNEKGMSTGKYAVYLKIKEFEPLFTEEEAAELSMKELRDKLASYIEISEEENRKKATAPGQQKGKKTA